MATASKAPAASTPKNTIPAAPTPSPRPMGRPFSHKSPATKTPASLHGHSHNMSPSSHPSSTPLAAPTFGEDALAYNSPAAAALIASIGSQGLTPLLNGQEGLGIVAESQVLSTKEGSISGKKNTEEEKLRNLQEAQRLLKTRSTGRAISREGVEKVVEQSTLNFAWLDDNNLSVAGNYVDLEIVFDDARRDSVRDVVLRINTSGVEEHKKDASAVLQKDLDPSDFDASTAPWKSLEAFSGNLARLAHLDHLSQHGLNCFEAVDGLYHSFQRIWAEEKKRLLTKHVLSRICEGALGRPAMHKKRKLGLSLDYWVENRRTKEDKPKPVEADAMDIDQIDSEPEKVDSSSRTWLARIGCESGYPPIRVSKDWLGEEVFPTDNADNSDEAGDEMRKPRWLSPEPTLVQSPNETDDVDEMVIEAAAAGVNIPKPPNIRFTFELEPAVWLPNSAISNMMTQGVTFAIDFSKASTYEEALHNFAVQQISPQSQHSSETHLQDANKAEKRWTKALTVLDKDGLAKQARHSYAVHYSTSLWAYPTQSFSFGHPRQLTEAIPVLRQSALLWSIMRKLTSQSDTPVAGAPAAKNELQGSQQRKKSREPQKKSNIKPQHAKLDAFLNSAGLSGRGAVHNSSWGLEEKAGVPIDVSLNMTFTNPTMPKLDLLFPLPFSSDGKPPDRAKEQRPFGTISIEIRTNGKIAVSSATGLPFSDSASLRKMANVLTVSEDLGVLVQWVLGRLQAG